MSVRRAQSEFDSAEFTEWIALRGERLGLLREPEQEKPVWDLNDKLLAWAFSRGAKMPSN